MKQPMTDPDHIDNMRYLDRLMDLWPPPFKQYGEDDRTYVEEEEDAKVEDEMSQA